MGIENYIFIATVYGLGVYLAYRAGFNTGFDTGCVSGIREAAQEIAQISDKKASEIIGMIRENRARRKALKS